MKITHFECTTVCVPFLQGILAPPEYDEPSAGYPQPLNHRNHDILHIHTDTGLSGVGMSGPYYGPRNEAFPESWLGCDPRSFDPRAIDKDGYGIALLDLIGKAIEWPLYRIFGGLEQSRILVDYWIGRMSAEDSAIAASRAKEAGFHGIKMKCIWEDGNIVDRVHAVANVAPGMRMILDPGHRFHSVKNSLELAREIEGLDVVFEDPIPKEETWQDYRRLKEETSILICPHLQNPSQVIAAVAARAVDGINVAPSGWAFLDMARIAASEGIPVWQASNVDLGVFDVYRAHASAAAGNCTLGSDLCGNFVHVHSLLAEAPVVDGYLIVNERPGLGIELDSEIVEMYTVKN